MASALGWRWSASWSSCRAGWFMRRAAAPPGAPASLSICRCTVGQPALPSTTRRPRRSSRRSSTSPGCGCWSSTMTSTPGSRPRRAWRRPERRRWFPARPPAWTPCSSTTSMSSSRMFVCRCTTASCSFRGFAPCGTAIQRQVPAVALSALAREDDRRRILDAGFQQFAAKPISVDRLLRCVAAAAASSADAAGPD